jgi:serine/threonine-protein kinase
LTAAADVYAFACTAYDLLTQRPPFVARSVAALLHMHTTVRPQPASTRRPEIAALDGVLLRALEKFPEDRFATAGELRAALEVAGDAWLEHATPGSGDAEAGDGLRILVVDDDDAFRAFAKRAAELALSEQVVRFGVAASGDEAIADAARRPPSIVVLDFDMPGLDGIATLSRLRSLPGGQAMRVLVVSARVAAAERWRFSALGVGDFLAKPVKLASLVETISDMARRASSGGATP